jgi:TPP-dependent pyruvate/acetoin dehydrogenase alpha subunit
MTLAEKLIKEFEQLTEEKKKEVIDFVEFVKAKEQKEIETLMDSVISENKEALKELAKL